MQPCLSKLSSCDKLHLKELVDLYYPVGGKDVENHECTINEIQEASFSPKPPIVYTKPPLKTYRCCHIKTTSCKKSVDHWIKEHYDSAKKEYFHGTSAQNDKVMYDVLNHSKRCKYYSDLGNTKFSLFERASYLLHFIQHAPSTCHFFRPHLNQDPRFMENPYTATFSLAYDYIDTIKRQPREYRYFLSRLLKKPLETQYSYELQDNLPFWIFWSKYHYPHNR